MAIAEQYLVDVLPLLAANHMTDYVAWGRFSQSLPARATRLFLRYHQQR